MRLTATTYGNNLSESRSYRVSGSNKDNLTASIAITNVSGFSYSYDANKNKSAEADAIAAAYSWSTGPEGYDDKDRLVSWARSSGDWQTWTLSKVGDWSTTTVNGTQETRTHNDVHELTARGAQALACNVKGNLTRAAGDSVDRYAWDYDNRLKSTDTTQDGTADVTSAIGNNLRL